MNIYPIGKTEWISRLLGYPYLDDNILSPTRGTMRLLWGDQPPTAFAIGRYILYAVARSRCISHWRDTIGPNYAKTKQY